MKTAKHPFSKVIHYATGGLITPTKAEFKTLCGRKFEQGHNELMMSGAYGAERVTCKNCRAILDENARKHEEFLHPIKIDRATLKALTALIDYTYFDEEKNWDENDRPTSGHIFLEIKKVVKFLKANKAWHA